MTTEPCVEVASRDDCYIFIETELMHSSSTDMVVTDTTIVTPAIKNPTALPATEVSGDSSNDYKKSSRSPSTPSTANPPGWETSLGTLMQYGWGNHIYTKEFDLDIYFPPLVTNKDKKAMVNNKNPLTWFKNKTDLHMHIQNYPFLCYEWNTNTRAIPEIWNHKKDQPISQQDIYAETLFMNEGWQKNSSHDDTVRI